MVEFARIIELRCQNRTSNYSTHDELIEDFVSVLGLTKKLFYDVLHYTYRCDVKYVTQYNKGSAYYELEKMIQTIIVEERVISSDDSCSLNCHSTNELINHSECLVFQNCQYITSRYEFCPSSNTSSRRYEWFKDQNGEVYGHFNHGNCLNKIESVESYYHARQVVVGVKFIKKDNMMHIQIKQSKLYSNGFTQNSNWKEVETIHKDDKFHSFFVVNGTHSKQLTPGIDYGFPNGINFDDVYAPEAFVVTGVRLQLAGNFINDDEFKQDSIGLEIRITRFDFSSGKLSLLETYWTSVSEDT
ncbi:hypothetical protein KQX54_004499, partial [Cotesia glomerata]